MSAASLAELTLKKAKVQGLGQAVQSKEGTPSQAYWTSSMDRGNGVRSRLLVPFCPLLLGLQSTTSFFPCHSRTPTPHSHTHTLLDVMPWRPRQTAEGWLNC